jgi:hypothetical protein
MFEPYPQRRRRSSSPQPTNSASPPSSEAHSPDMSGNRTNNDQKKAIQTAKRAAQNRAAQRAFRQRRERYVKDLEIKVKEMDAIQEEMSKLAEQNLSYRKQIENLTRELRQLKDAGGQSFSPYANKQVMTPKSPPPPPPPPPQCVPTSDSPSQNNPRFKPIPKDVNGNQGNRGSFEAEMARRLSHSERSTNQDSSPYSESLYSLQQRRGLHSPRKPVSAAVSSRTNDYQLPVPTSNPDQNNNSVTTFHHQSSGQSINDSVDRRKNLTPQTTPLGPQVKSMPENGTYIPSAPTPMMDHSYPLSSRSDVGILPSPAYGNEQQRFIHQFGEIDNTNPELVGMIDMPPLPMGDGEFEMEDPFAAEDGADDLDFAPEDCDRILDDLVTILQQRNRPQIPHNLNPTEA